MVISLVRKRTTMVDAFVARMALEKISSESEQGIGNEAQI